VGTAEFPDLPMPQPPTEDVYYDLFKAKHTTNYLESYVDHHKWVGKSLRERILLNTEVQSVSRASNGWAVNCQNREKGTKVNFQAAKLIIASGLTSIPNMPSLNQDPFEKFDGPIIHQESFGSSAVLESSKIKRITVLGGGKSSADMVYSAVKAGKEVSWVLKGTATTGPGFFLSPQGKGPYKNTFEIALTRVASTFTPSIYNPENLWSRFLHSSSYGIKLMRWFWNAVNKETLSDANYDGRDSIKGFSLLKPHSP
jgi:dimethylaniline monooxygenase (N-oxide forming)